MPNKVKDGSHCRIILWTNHIVEQSYEPVTLQNNPMNQSQLSDNYLRDQQHSKYRRTILWTNHTAEQPYEPITLQNNLSQSLYTWSNLFPIGCVCTE